MASNSQGAMGLLAVPIGVLREQEAERVSEQAAVALPHCNHIYLVSFFRLPKANIWS